jgi:hypothetical protein
LARDEHALLFTRRRLPGRFHGLVSDAICDGTLGLPPFDLSLLLTARSR